MPCGLAAAREPSGNEPWAGERPARLPNAIRDHGGTIEVFSAEGTGTTFRVSLPLAGGGRE